MHNLKKQILSWGTAAVLAAIVGTAQAQQPTVPAANVGASSVVSSGQNDFMRNADKQAREASRQEQGQKKAQDAAKKNKLPPPKTLDLSSRPVGKLPSDWTFSDVIPMVRLPDGKTAPEKDLAAEDARRALKDLSAPTATDLMKAARDNMIARGYFLYSPISVTTNETKRQLELTADFGHVESLTVDFGSSKAANGRYFNQDQIRNAYMRGVGASSVFNYNNLYQRFYELNAHPDLTGKLSLHAVTNDSGVVGAEVRRLALRLNVEESLPLHFVLGIDNNGTDAAENWMARATLQYLNLTKHDDVVTLNYQNSLTDIDALGGLAASYYLPHTFGTMRDFAWTVYGGWTDVNSKDVVPDIDVEGSAWFVGMQESFGILPFSDVRRSLRLSLGFVRRYVEDNLVVQDQTLEGNDVTVMPFTLSLMYSDKQLDALEGMNFLTLEVLTEFGDFLGTANEEEMKAQRMAAEKDYTVGHLQLARLQMLPFLSFGGTNRAYGNPMLFAKVNGQYASGALIPAEQFGLGGDGSVRGYATREYLGDHGVSGTLEFRMPIILGLVDRKTDMAHAPWDRLQGVAFFDAGYVKIEDPLPGEEPDKALYGAGVGMRMAITDYFQIRCDLAFPLEKTEDSDTLCVHFSGQVQF